MPYLTDDQTAKKLKKRKETWALDDQWHMENKKMYESKKAVLLSGKKRGRKVFDRAGTIEY